MGLFFLAGSQFFDTGVTKDIDRAIGTILMFMAILKD